MTCGVNQCDFSQTICVPRGDSRELLFTVHENDCDGALLDISGASEIVFIVADEFGGTVRIEKRLTDLEIEISNNLYQFSVELTGADTDTLVRVSNYFECRITSATGRTTTVANGLFKSQDTMIKDLA